MSERVPWGSLRAILVEVGGSHIHSSILGVHLKTITEYLLVQTLLHPEKTAVNKTDDSSLHSVYIPAEEQILANQTNKYVI